MSLNNFLEVDYTRYGDISSSSSISSQLTDKVIAKGMVKYLRRYYQYDGRWTGWNVRTRLNNSDFLRTAELLPNRFYAIFKDTPRTEQFLNYFNEFKVKAKLEGGYLSLIDLDHPKNKKR
ncbi:hypothetical protein ACSU64_04460 [Bacillaceae bacterium C204]|uniref:hypothetical protein n=1 Tax=Neobacillus sp. 204 TaxID=3383351 RepID=UPI00397B5BD9